MARNLIELAQQRLKSPEGLSLSIEELTSGIIELYQGGQSQNAIAHLYGISQGYVSKVLRKHNIVTREGRFQPKIPRNKP